MAELASRANVAKGSVYDYFDSKEDLYLYVCRDGLERSRKAVYGGIDPSWDLYRKLRHIFSHGVKFADSYPEYVAMYVNISSAGMETFAEELSLEVEKFTADYLKGLIRAGVKQGLVRKNVDVKLSAFIINSLYIMFLSSLVSLHYRIRVKEYLEIKSEPDEKTIAKHIEATISLIEGFLRPKDETPQKGCRGASRSALSSGGSRTTPTR